MKRTLTALAAVSIATILSACGSDNGQSEGATSSSNTGNFDGFDTPWERDAALATYACALMEQEDPSEVAQLAGDTIKADPLLRDSYIGNRMDEAIITGRPILIRNEGRKVTCDESDPDFSTWIKVGYHYYLDQNYEFDRDKFEESGLQDSQQYADEMSGEAVSLINDKAGLNR